MINFMSKRETPLLESDALHILRLSREEYAAALSSGRLQRSIEVANDPTRRLAFHNFWDLLEFSLNAEFAKLSIVPDVDANHVAQYCDELASDDYDVIAITGDAEADHAVARRSWIDDTITEGWPPRFLDHCTILLVRTGHHIHRVAAVARGLGTSSWHDKDVESLSPNAEEPLWQERKAV